MQIQEQSDRIDSLNAQLEQSQAKRDQVEDLFHQRMLALYLEGNTSTLELLLGAESYADFLTRSQYMNSQASSDQALLDQLLALENQMNADRTEMESTRSSLEANQAQVQSLQAEQDAKIADLETLQQQSQAEEADLQMHQDAYSADAQQYQEELEQANAELEAIARANANKYANATQPEDNSSSGGNTSSGSTSLWQRWGQFFRRLHQQLYRWQRFRRVRRRQCHCTGGWKLSLALCQPQYLFLLWLPVGQYAPGH